MIHRLRHAHLSGRRFSTAHLPAEVQDAVLRHLVVPRVASSSMWPTLMPGDTLELEPVDELCLGDVLVFRRGDDYVCHRLVGTRDGSLLMHGDASTGEPEAIERSQLVGRVSAVVRDGLSLQHPRRKLNGRLGLRLRAALSRGAFRRVCHVAARCLRRPVLGEAFKRMTRRWIAVEILEAAPLACTQSFVSRSMVRLHQREQLVSALGAHHDRESLLLILRMGPLILGICRLSPWSLSLRSGAQCFDLEEALEPLADVLRSTTGAGPKTVETLRT